MNRIKNNLRSLVFSIVIGASVLFSGSNVAAQNNILGTWARSSAMDPNSKFTPDQRVGLMQAANLADLYQKNEEQAKAEEEAAKLQAKLDEINRLQQQIAVKKTYESSDANYSEQNTTNRGGLPNVFACNYWKDLNGNNTAENEEYGGVKKEFYQGEEIRIATKVVNQKDKTLQRFFYNSNGLNVFKEYIQIERDNIVIGVADYRPDAVQFAKNLGNAPIGSYKVVNYIDGVYYGSCDYEIKPIPGVTPIKASQENEEKTEIFTCNYWLDLNKDSFTAEQEWVGKNKKEFSLEERILINARAMNLKDQKYEVNIFGPNGDKIYSNTGIVNSIGMDIGLDDCSNRAWTEELVKKNGKGTYKAAFYINEKLQDSCEFLVK